MTLHAWSSLLPFLRPAGSSVNAPASALPAAGVRTLFLAIFMCAYINIIILIIFVCRVKGAHKGRPYGGL